MPVTTSLSRGLVAAALAATFSLVSTPASAAVIRFVTTLSPEVSGATGSGSATVLFDTTLQTLSLETTFSGLSGLTTVAHIHCCTTVPRAGTVGVAVTPGTLPGFPGTPTLNGVSAGSYSTLLNLTLASTYTTAFVNNFGGGTVPGASAALLQGMYDGKAYLNIHSSTFGSGEIRGFLAVPEPASMLLLGAALAGFAVRRRRQ